MPSAEQRLYNVGKCSLCTGLSMFVLGAVLTGLSSSMPSGFFKVSGPVLLGSGTIFIIIAVVIVCNWKDDPVPETTAVIVQTASCHYDNVSAPQVGYGPSAATPSQQSCTGAEGVERTTRAADSEYDFPPPPYTAVMKTT